MEKDDYLEKRFARSPLIVFRKIGSKFILVPIKQKAVDVEEIYNMNEVAGRIWELIDGKRQIKDIRDVIAEEFAVEPEVAVLDLMELMKQLEEIGAVKEV